MARPGNFVWYELMTTDMAGAEAFYRSVVGWTARDAGMPDFAYTLFQAGDTMIAGLMTLPEAAKAMGARPGWLGYILVEDVDAAAKRLAEAGGTVHKQPEDIPGVGRFAVVADPQGAFFALYRGITDMPEPAGMNNPGHVGWRELLAVDGPTAFDFYAGQFGWTKDQAMDMGPVGVYQLFASGGPAVGAIMTKPAEVPVPFWGFYFQVDGIDAAIGRIKAGGGTVILEPTEVPGGAWICQGIDPQGAYFALVGNR